MNKVRNKHDGGPAVQCRKNHGWYLHMHHLGMVALQARYCL